MSDAVESMGVNIPRGSEQESPWVFNTHEDVNADAEHASLKLGPANVVIYD